MIDCGAAAKGAELLGGGMGNGGGPARESSPETPTTRGELEMNKYLPPPTGPQSGAQSGSQSGSPESGTGLAQLLRGGGRPAPFPVPLRLERGEECHAQGPANLEMFVPGGDGSYVHKTRFGFSPLGVAVGMGTMIGNQARKAKAARDAREDWRSMGKATAYFTTHRVAINQKQDWMNVWYSDVMTAGCDGRSIQIQRNGDSAVRLTLPNIHYFYVMFYWLAFDQILDPPAEA